MPDYRNQVRMIALDMNWRNTLVFMADQEIPLQMSGMHLDLQDMISQKVMVLMNINHFLRADAVKTLTVRDEYVDIEVEGVNGPQRLFPMTATQTVAQRLAEFQAALHEAGNEDYELVE
jgi:hypothetical protein